MPEIDEVFNTHFTNIDPNMASEIPLYDIPPENYLTQLNTTLSLRNTSVNKVKKKTDTREATR